MRQDGAGAFDRPRYARRRSRIRKDGRGFGGDASAASEVTSAVGLGVSRSGARVTASGCAPSNCRGEVHHALRIDEAVGGLDDLRPVGTTVDRVRRRSSPSHRIKRLCESKVVPLPPIVVLTSPGACPGVNRKSLFWR